MDPIKPTGGPSGPSPLRPTSGADAPGGKKPFSVDPIGRQPDPGRVGPDLDSGADFQRLKASIRKAVDAGADRDQTLEHVVADEVHRTLGPYATPETIQKLTTFFKEDPNISTLFSRLYAAAVSDG